MPPRLGQHWLANPDTARAIANALAPQATEPVLEIGGGRGALTQHLVGRSDRLVIRELDDRWATELEERFGGAAEISRGDILKLDLAQLGSGPWAVVGNLPYWATSPILLWLCAQAPHLSRAVVMIQKEVAERVVAVAGGEGRGRLSVALQYRFRPEIIMSVPPSDFRPPPRVDSAVLHLLAHPAPAVVVANERRFFEVVEIGFRFRRKTLLTALSSGAGTRLQVAAALEAAGIDPRRRAESLELAEWATLSAAMDA